ncbi:hypothetical protein [Silvimonas iriomotensis]|uniref:Uncharacterized protein n=1 Tax=Silvimonas iriomotensis TaxID=449662 RepID=A0ABQ2P668_9NEIS|nr:hypothetical protein [Silvimonas iriomotensis]GGP18881.1 hypothetical protein GCM10010970_07850 [Silvimonas iriomotensis]
MLPFVAKLLGAGTKTDGSLDSPAWRGRNFCSDLIPSEAAADPQYQAVKGDEFKAEQCYFSVRIAEVRLAEAGSYIATYLPMCSCFLRYRYGDDVREVPFIINYDTIRGELNAGADQRGGQHIEFKNLYIVRDAPLKAGGLVMHTALCRMSDTTFASGMLDFIGDAAGTIGGAAAGLIARTGVDMTKRLGKLLGAGGVTTRFGIYDGSALQKSGYRVFAGADVTQDAELEIEQGQLKQKNAQGQTVVIDDMDYILVAFEYRKSMCDSAFSGASMPFNTIWDEVKSRLIRGSPDAQEALNRLLDAIARSADLIEPDRLTMVSTYLEEYKRWKTTLLGGDVVKGGTDQHNELADGLDRIAISKGLTTTTRSLLKETASRIGSKKSLLQTTGFEALTTDALSERAATIRAKLDAKLEEGSATPDSLAEASARVVAMALSSQV